MSVILILHRSNRNTPNIESGHFFQNVHLPLTLPLNIFTAAFETNPIVGQQLFTFLFPFLVSSIGQEISHRRKITGDSE